VSAPTAVARFDPPPADPTFWNGLGVLLYEQRRLRRADPRRRLDRALSPFASLRRRVQAATATPCATFAVPTVPHPQETTP
jgi:hypothetical protein